MIIGIILIIANNRFLLSSNEDYTPEIMQQLQRDNYKAEQFPATINSQIIEPAF